VSRNSGVGMGVKSRGFGKGEVHALKHIAMTAKPEATRISACERFILVPDLVAAECKSRVSLRRAGG
jgi:hypothetical protein